jgi:recombination protein RecA
MAKINTQMLERMKAAASRINTKLSKDLDKDGAKIYVIGDKENVKFAGWSCGVPAIDDALGGQIPCGRIVEISGQESSGKTTLCHHIEASFQKAFPNKGIAFIDAEHAMDPNYAKKIGVNNDGILVLQPDSGILALNAAVALAEDKEADIGLIIIDSVAALTTQSDEEKNIGEAVVAEQARMVSTAMRILNTVCAIRGITLILTNQQRTDVMVTYGDKNTTPAGKAIKFYSSIRLKLSGGDKIKDGEEVIGMNCKLNCIKNKMSPPFRTAKYAITFGVGIDPYINIVNYCLENKKITKKGAWYMLGESKWQGVKAIVDQAKADVKFYEELKTLVGDIKALEMDDDEKVPEADDAPPTE